MYICSILGKNKQRQPSPDAHDSVSDMHIKNNT